MTDKNQVNALIDGHAIAEKAYDDRKNPFENQGNGMKNRFKNISNGSSIKQPFITEKPVPTVTFSHSDNTVNKPKRKHRRDKSDLGENFVAPDGGWGWFVAIAAGLNILSAFSLTQQMGIIFRQHFESLSINSSQITTIINTHMAVASFTGLLNGPIFRRFTYRQVALLGASLSFIGHFMAVFAGSFILYMISIAVLYGLGRGFIVSSSSLAVNTFFKLKRRTATAYQFGAAGLNAIFLPYLATYLLTVYGTHGTVLMFSGIALHGIAFSLIFQPVQWHVRKMDTDAEAAVQATITEEHEIEHMLQPETPVLSRANDGWFGSKSSLNSPTVKNQVNSWPRRKSTGSSGNSQWVEMKQLMGRNEIYGGKVHSKSICHSIQEEELHHLQTFDQENRTQEIEDGEEKVAQIEVEEKSLSYTEVEKMNESKMHKDQERKVAKEAEAKAIDDEDRSKLPFYRKVIIFFDLDLLRDITYVNLVVGLTFINFAEVNFGVLTPFILNEFGFSNKEIAIAMSCQGCCDLAFRFLVPMITRKINLSNKGFFALGVIGMCIGRAVLSITRNFAMLVPILIFLGCSKAFRIVFWSIIIPGYVPLKRLPAAAGLQLLMSGIFTIICGPLVGLIRDETNFAVTLHFLNALSLIALSLWLLESLYQRRMTKAPPAEGAS